MKKIIVLALIVNLLLGFLPGTKVLGANRITIKGSDTMVNLGAAWAEEFMKKFPKVSLSVTGGGSGIGISALIDGNTDIAQSSREIRAAEIDRAKTKGVNPYATVVAFDGVAIAINPNNPLKELTMEQLSLIYQGRITSWKDFGWDNKEIVVLSRDAASGTHFFFLEHVVQMTSRTATWGPKTIFIPNTSTIVEEVARNPYAIGYIGLGYVKPSVKIVGISSKPGSPAVTPSIATVMNRTYPISRPLFFYTNGEPVGEVKYFIDFVLSTRGQVIVEENGFVPLTELKPVTIKLTLGQKNYTVNNVNKSFDTVPTVISGRTFLPVRFIAEDIGGMVFWHDKYSKVTITLKDDLLELWIGNNKARLNFSQEIMIDPQNPKITPFIQDGRTMLPLRFIVETFGGKIEWNEKTKEILINFKR